MQKRRSVPPHSAGHPRPPREEPGATVRDEEGGVILKLSGWWLVGSVVVLRLTSAVMNQTAFVPDEYWQSLEVAHRMVFGYGYQTWEWRESIRGYTHPLLYATLYKVLSLLHIDYGYLLVELPKVMNALFGAICDVYVLKLATHLYGPKAGGFALLCNVSSWILFYCLPRSLANSLETVLTAPLLYHWFMAVNTHTTAHHTRRRHTVFYLCLSAVAVLVRPTAMVLSVPLVICQLYWRQRDLKMILQCCVAIGFLALVWSLGVDCYFYQKPVFVQWNFFVFNVLEGHSALYGTHPWHWYLSQGGSAVLGTTLPLLLLLLLCLSRARSVLGLMALGGWVVLAHSLLAHKEFRFIMCVVPIASVLGGHTLNLLFSSKKLRVLGWCGCAAMLANFPAILWLCLVHQRGTLDVMTFLRSNITDDSSILFLMPCHSTPYYSHIHRNIEMEFLECPPQLRSGDVDVEREFYQSPRTWLDRRYPDSHTSVPTHLVMYDILVKDVQSFLKLHNYLETTKLFHTLHPLDTDMGTHIVVYIPLY